MKKAIVILVCCLALGGVFFFMRGQKTMVVVSGAGETAGVQEEEGDMPQEPEAQEEIVNRFGDIGFQEPLASPPETVKGIYLTGWSAGSSKKMADIKALIARTELNAVVIDIKDYSGYVSYPMDIEEVKRAGADSDIRIPRINALIKDLHDQGIYVVGRLTVFQDPLLAKSHPEWALGKKGEEGVWTDRKGLAWMDPAAKPVWEYNVAIAKDAIARGFDEVNFDYVRFASDGDLDSIAYPFWDEVTYKQKVIREFFSFLRSELSDATISVDLFGLTTVNKGDLGIGQKIEDAYEFFDYVCPMVYPSHYASGFIGYDNPGAHPYEVMTYSLDRALDKWLAMGPQTVGTSTIPGIPLSDLGKIRPWIQDFDLGATYTADLVRSEFQAVYDSLRDKKSGEAYAGWFIWDPANRYTEGALEKRTEETEMP